MRLKNLLFLSVLGILIFSSCRKSSKPDSETTEVKEPRNRQRNPRTKQNRSDSSTVKVSDLQAENERLKAELQSVRGQVPQTKQRNSYFSQCKYPDFISIILNRKKTEEMETLGKPPAYFGTWFDNLHDAQYTETEILKAIDQLIENEIEYLSKSIKFNYNSIAEQDTSNVWVYVKRT